MKMYSSKLGWQNVHIGKCLISLLSNYPYLQNKNQTSVTSYIYMPFWTGIIEYMLKKRFPCMRG